MSSKRTVITLEVAGELNAAQLLKLGAVVYDMSNPQLADVVGVVPSTMARWLRTDCRHAVPAECHASTLAQRLLVTTEQVKSAMAESRRQQVAGRYPALMRISAIEVK